jgi:hypothetical protein
MTTGIHWTRISLTTGREDIAEGYDPARIRALEQYRRTRAIVGVWLVSTEELGQLDDDASAEAGPTVDEIEWDGFDHAFDAYELGVSAYGIESMKSADDVLGLVVLPRESAAAAF